MNVIFRNSVFAKNVFVSTLFFAALMSYSNFFSLVVNANSNLGPIGKAKENDTNRRQQQF